MGLRVGSYRHVLELLAGAESNTAGGSIQTWPAALPEVLPGVPLDQTALEAEYRCLQDSTTTDLYDQTSNADHITMGAGLYSYADLGVVRTDDTLAEGIALDAATVAAYAGVTLYVCFRPGSATSAVMQRIDVSGGNYVYIQCVADTGYRLGYNDGVTTEFTPTRTAFGGSNQEFAILALSFNTSTAFVFGMNESGTVTSNFESVAGMPMASITSVTLHDWRAGTLAYAAVYSAAHDQTTFERNARAIIGQVRGRDATYGLFTTVPVVEYNLWGSIRPLSGQERTLAAGAGVDATHEIRLPYSDRVTESKRLRHSGVEYDIQFVNDQRLINEELVLRASERR